METSSNGMKSWRPSPSPNPSPSPRSPQLSADTWHPVEPPVGKADPWIASDHHSESVWGHGPLIADWDIMNQDSFRGASAPWNLPQRRKDKGGALCPPVKARVRIGIRNVQDFARSCYLTSNPFLDGKSAETKKGGPWWLVKRVLKCSISIRYLNWASF